MFVLGERVVYPAHGVACISRILDKRVGSSITSFFELTFVNKQMTILVPVDNAVLVGIRQLSSRQGIDSVFKLLGQPASATLPNEAAATNWNKRNKEYQGRIRTGDLCEICGIYRDLRALEGFKGLSFGEKSLLQQTEALLAEEIAIVYDIDVEKAIDLLRSLVSKVQAQKAAKMVRTASR